MVFPFKTVPLTCIQVTIQLLVRSNETDFPLSNVLSQFQMKKDNFLMCGWKITSVGKLRASLLTSSFSSAPQLSSWYHPVSRGVSFLGCLKKPSGLNDGNVCSHSPGDQKSKTKCQRRYFPLRAVREECVPGLSPGLGDALL